MLIFSTKIYVNAELTNEKFVELTKEWISGIKYYNVPDFVWDKKLEFCVSNPENTENLYILNYPEAFIIHFVNNVDGVIWTTDFILTEVEGKKVLCTHLYQDAEDVSVKLPDEYFVPSLLRMVIAGGYSDYDNELIDNGELYVADKESDLPMLKSIILGEKNYLMPVVYCSYDISDSKYTQYDMKSLSYIAKSLSGIAHVVYVKENLVHDIKEMTDDKDPYGGTVGIFFGSTCYTIYGFDFKDAEALTKELKKIICKKLISAKIDKKFLLSEIRYDYIKNENINTEELLMISEEMIDEKDQINTTKDIRIQELEDELTILKNKLLAYESKFAYGSYSNYKASSSDNSSSESNDSASGAPRNAVKNTITIEIGEEDIYDNELKERILKLVAADLKLIDSDPNLKETRRYHVLKSILDNNEMTNNADKIRKEVKDIMGKDKNLSTAKKKDLLRLGFDITHDDHYKIVYKEDERYKIVYSSSPTDYRTSLNAISTLLNKIL